MERQIRMLSPLLLLLLLVTASEMGTAVAGRTCESPSATFKGICLSSDNCASMCKGEGFLDGSCSGFRRRCLCAKPC